MSRFAILYRQGGGLDARQLDPARHQWSQDPDCDAPHVWLSPAGDIAVLYAEGTLHFAEPQSSGSAMLECVLSSARLDDAPDLARHLQLPASSTHEHLVASAVLRDGEQATARLNGDFAWALWRDHVLHLGVDHIGQRALYHARTATGFVVTTHLPLLLALPGAPRGLNEEALVLLAATHFGSGPCDTAFADVHLLPGGHCMSLDAHGSGEPRRWWQPDIAIRRRYRDVRDYTHELEEVFGTAVRVRLPQAGPVGCNLSGGLDSSLVAAFAAPMLAAEERTLHAWTSIPHEDLPLVSSPGRDANEWRFAAETAAMHANMHHHGLSPRGICLLDVLADVHRSSATPVRNSANYLWVSQIPRQARQHGCRVVLTGQRGNASISFAGAGGVAGMLRSGQWARFTGHIAALPGRRGRQLLRLGLAGVLGESRLHKLLQSRNGVPGKAWLPLLSPAARTLLAGYALPALNVADRTQWLAFLGHPHPAFNADISAMTGAELRDPTADRRLHEYLLGCPADAFVGEGFDRLQARLLGAGRLPDSVRWKRSRGEQCPEEALWFTLYPERYREAWSRVRTLPWAARWLDCMAVDRQLQLLLDGEPVTKDRAAAMHRLLDIGLFILHAQQCWPVTPHQDALT